MAGVQGSRVGNVLVAMLLAACPTQPGVTGTASTTSGSTGSATGSGPTESSSSSSSGGATTTAGAQPMRCASQCEGDRDCLVAGEDKGFRCVAGLCDVPACTSDERCVADYSGWKTPCADQAGCAAGEACIDVEGEGRCALAPGVFACADFGLVELARPTVAGDMMVTVCGQANVSCEAGECVAPCSGDDACPAQMGHPFCNVMSGQCECQIDQDCLDSQLPGYTLCLGGRCGCGSDADCDGGQNVDTCYSGVCGCSSDATCTQMIFDGAPLTCQ